MLGLSATKSKKITPYMLLLPALLCISAVIFYPILKAIIMSFQHYSLLRLNKITFAGFANYSKALNDEVFWLSLKNTVVYVSFSVGLQFVLGLCLALILHQDFFLKKFARIVMLIPWIVPGVLGAFMWRWLLNGNYGLINDLLMKAGIIENNIAWLSRPDTAMPAAILTTVWRGMPFFALMLLAGLQAVPKDLYEASRIDGANGWQQLFGITIPVIMPVIIATTLLRIIWTANFVDLIFLLTEGGPGYSTQVLPVYTFTTARTTLNYGYSAALAMFLTLVLILVVLLYLQQIKKEQII